MYRGRKRSHRLSNEEKERRNLVYNGERIRKKKIIKPISPSGFDKFRTRFLIFFSCRICKTGYEKLYLSGEECVVAKVPHNLRQVGNPGGNLSIYIEDYVFTYLKSEYNTQAAILIGESCYGENGIRVYIRGAICCPQLFWQDEGMQLSQRTWNYIFRERDHLFPNQEIVGWYMPLPQNEEEKTLVAVGEFHGRNFPGADKVFFYLDQAQGEDAFFARDGQVFSRQTGYYIFYEKNTAMREYMLALRQERQLEADLFKEVHDMPRENTRYREFLNAELEKRKDASTASTYIIGAVALAAVVLVIVGFGIGDKKLNRVEAALQTVIERFGIELKNPADPDDVENIISDTNSSEEEEGSQEQENAQNSENAQSPENPQDKDDGQGSANNQEDASQEDSSIIEDTQFDTEVDEEATIIAMSLAQGYYVVRQGEGLSQICCKLYGDDSKLEEICEKNNIEDPNTIYPGQIIYLP